MESGHDYHMLALTSPSLNGDINTASLHPAPFSQTGKFSVSMDVIKHPHSMTDPHMRLTQEPCSGSLSTKVLFPTMCSMQWHTSVTWP